MKPYVLLGMLTLVSFTAQAADSVLQPKVGAAAAFGTFSGENSPPGVLSGNVDDDTVGFKVYGQYPLNDWLAVEAAYYDSTKFKSKQKLTDVPPGEPRGQYELSFDGWSAQGVVYIPNPVEGFQVYVKGGYYNFDDELALNDVTLGSSSERGLVLGGGAAFMISDHLGLRADFDWYDADVGDLTTVNFGLEYSFGGAAAGK